jgi:hypothetical protein
MHILNFLSLAMTNFWKVRTDNKKIKICFRNIVKLFLAFKTVSPMASNFAVNFFCYLRKTFPNIMLTLFNPGGRREGGSGPAEPDRPAREATSRQRRSRPGQGRARTHPPTSYLLPDRQVGNHIQLQCLRYVVFCPHGSAFIIFFTGRDPGPLLFVNHSPDKDS